MCLSLGVLLSGCPVAIALLLLYTSGCCASCPSLSLVFVTSLRRFHCARASGSCMFYSRWRSWGSSTRRRSPTIPTAAPAGTLWTRRAGSCAAPWRPRARSTSPASSSSPCRTAATRRRGSGACGSSSTSSPTTKPATTATRWGGWRVRLSDKQTPVWVQGHCLFCFFLLFGLMRTF